MKSSDVIRLVENKKNGFKFICCLEDINEHEKVILACPQIKLEFVNIGAAPPTPAEKKAELNSMYIRNTHRRY